MLDENLANTSNLITKLQSGNNLTIYFKCSLEIISVTTKLVAAQLELTIGQYPAMVKDAADVMQSLLECSDGVKKKMKPALYLQRMLMIFDKMIKFFKLY